MIIDPKTIENSLKAMDINIQCSLRAHVDYLTKMLVRVMEEIEYQEPGIILDDDVIEWWNNHKSNL